MHFLKYETETEIHGLHDKSHSIAYIYISNTSRLKNGNTERHSCLCSAWTSILILHSLAIKSDQVSSPQVLWQFWFLFCSKGKNLKEQTLPYSKQRRICHHQCFCSSIENDGRCFQSSVFLGESLKWTVFIFELDEIASVHSLHFSEVVNNFLFLFSTFPALSLEEVGSLNLHTVSLHIL